MFGGFQIYIYIYIYNSMSKREGIDGELHRVFFFFSYFGPPFANEEVEMEKFPMIITPHH